MDANTEINNLCEYKFGILIIWFINYSLLDYIKNNYIYIDTNIFYIFLFILINIMSLFYVNSTETIKIITYFLKICLNIHIIINYDKIYDLNEYINIFLFQRIDIYDNIVFLIINNDFIKSTYIINIIITGIVYKYILFNNYSITKKGLFICIYSFLSIFIYLILEPYYYFLWNILDNHSFKKYFAKVYVLNTIHIIFLSLKSLFSPNNFDNKTYLIFIILIIITIYDTNI